MESAFALLAAVAILLALAGIGGARSSLRQTTLMPAWRWAVAAGLTWAVAWTITLGQAVSHTAADAAWYLAALLAVCPAVAVLGARRPGSGVWTMFVVVPLLAVLGWPMLTLLGRIGESPILRLETPQLLGFVLVLVMGAGNYFGTRQSLAAALFTVSVCLIVGTVSAVSPVAVQGSTTARHIATVGLGMSVQLARWISKSRVEHLEGFDRLWTDYRETFGIVWAKRFQERMNGIARQQRWPARLRDHGLEWSDGPITNQSEVCERIDQTFRWLLRRFVDPPWIEERLDEGPAAHDEPAPK